MRGALPAAVVQDGIAVAGGRVFLATADGAVYCLGAAAGGSATHDRRSP